MYSEKFHKHLSDTLADLDNQGLFKRERIIASHQAAEITLQNGSRLLNFCANNYLGLSDHPEIIKASQDMLDKRGYGMSSVRFICGSPGHSQRIGSAYRSFFGNGGFDSLCGRF